MASSEAPTGRPRGGKMVKVQGSARARAIELIKNPRRQYDAYPTSPSYCRLRFLISLTVRALAAPRRLTFYAGGPFSMTQRSKRESTRRDVAASIPELPSPTRHTLTLSTAPAARACRSRKAASLPIASRSSRRRRASKHCRTAPPRRPKPRARRNRRRRRRARR